MVHHDLENLAALRASAARWPIGEPDFIKSGLPFFGRILAFSRKILAVTSFCSRPNIFA